MSRTISECPSTPVSNTWPETQFVSRSYEIQVVTPIFGGGVEPGQTDPITPVRGSSIRGHLRFWWRATRGAAFSSTERLREREVEIWGNTDNPSPVLLTVEAVGSPARRDFERFGPEAYALFSAKQNGTVLCREGLKFRLVVRWPQEHVLQTRRDRDNEQRRQRQLPVLPARIDDITLDVETALRAWLRFGGIGARTRRGCGGVHSASEEIQGPLALGSGMVVLVGRGCNTPVEAWRAAVKVYQEFRQSFRGPRHKKKLASGKEASVPGRSYWPEPDSLRKLTGCSLKPAPGGPVTSDPPEVNTSDHSAPVVSSEVLPAFPRASLGLPIIFHFADGPGEKRPARSDRDPAAVELLPLILNERGDEVAGTRMASPVITRPVFYEGKWCPGLMLLHRPIELCAVLQGHRALWTGGGATDLNLRVNADQIANDHFSRLRPFNSSVSIWDAFISFAKKAGFKEAQP